MNDKHGSLKKLFCCHFSSRLKDAIQPRPKRSGCARAVFLMMIVPCAVYGFSGLEGPFVLDAVSCFASHSEGAFSSALFLFTVCPMFSAKGRWYGRVASTTITATARLRRRLLLQLIRKPCIDSVESSLPPQPLDLNIERKMRGLRKCQTFRQWYRRQWYRKRSPEAAW